MRAVDRVDVPADGAGPRLGAVLLADQPVIGIGRRDQAADRALDGRVSLRDEGAIRFRLDDEIAPEVLERQGVRGVATGQREGQPGVVARRVGRRFVVHARILAPSGVVERLASDLEADPVAEDLDLAARPDRRPIGRQA